MSNEYAIALGIIAMLATILTRALPFLLFSGKRKMPEALHALGRVLPPAMIGTLVVYCVRNTKWTNPSSVLTELISVIVVITLHLWKKNTVLSIVSGTVCYMVLMRVL